MNISQFSYKDLSLDVTFNNGYVACTFVHNGKTYGQKIKLESKKVMDVVNVSFLLLTNAIETYENLLTSGLESGVTGT